MESYVKKIKVENIIRSAKFHFIKPFDSWYVMKYILIVGLLLSQTLVFPQTMGRKPANKRIVKAEYSTKKVIDTLEAERIFEEEKKPLLLAEYQKKVELQQEVEKLYTSEAKKVTSSTDLALLYRAYEEYFKKHPRPQSIHQSLHRALFPKDLVKGKLSIEVRKYLSFYNKQLKDELQNEYKRINMGWNVWLYEDEIPYVEKTDTIIVETEITENDVWDYIYTLNLVSEKTKDAAFTVPTSMLTGKTWLLRSYQDRHGNVLEDEKPLFYCFSTHGLTGKLIFYTNGKFAIEREVEPHKFASGGSWEKVPTGTIWKVTYNGSWIRYKNEYICMRPDVASVKVSCIKYQGTPYHQLSARIKSNINDDIIEHTKEIKTRMLDEQIPIKRDAFNKEYRPYKYVEYPNTKERSLCERLDEYFLILGGHKYVNEDRFYEIYEKSIK